MRINRANLLEQLYQFSLAGSGVIIGKPGIGKSYLIGQLCNKLLEAHILTFNIKIDNLFDTSDQAFNMELGMKNWIEELQEYELTDNVKGVLVFDAFDAARDETLRNGVLRQIKKAKKLLSEKWNIIVSARTYDASKSPELTRLFPVKAANNTVMRSRSIEIGPLQDQEILEALKDNPLLQGFFTDASGQLKEILHVPFFLLLLEAIVQQSNPTEIADIKKYQSETQLLQLYWQKKVIDTMVQTGNERLLSQLTLFFVRHRVLSCPKDVFYRDFIGADTDAFTWLRSENVLDEVSVNTSRIAFSHNILFDYAVSRFCLSASYHELLGFIEQDKSRPFFLRPSFIYFFTALWYGAPQTFWDLYKRLSQNETKEIQLLVRLVLNGIVASEFTSVEALEPLLEVGDEMAKTTNVKNLLQSIRFIRSKSASQDVDLLLYISTRLKNPILFDFAFLLQRASNEQKDEHRVQACGQAARNFFTFILEARKSNQNKFFLDRMGAGWGVELVARTYQSDATASNHLLAQIFDMLQEPDFEIAWFTQLSEYANLIIEQDPAFVARIYMVIFGHNELSNERTEMGSSVLMRFTSTRRQDYEMCFFRLESIYPDFLVKAPELAIPTAMTIVNQTLLNKHLQWSKTARSVTFAYKEIPCQYIPDNSASWSVFSLQGNESVNMLVKIVNYLEELLVNKKPYEGVLQQYISNAQTALTWKLLIKLGSKFPETLGKELFPLLTVREIIGGIDTSFEARELMEKISPQLANEAIKTIEEAIFNTYTGEGKNPEILAMALSRLPAERLQLQQSKDFLLLNTAVVNTPPFQTSSFSETYTSDKWLEDEGVDLTDPLNNQLATYSNQLGTFNSQFLNGTAQRDQYLPYFEIVQQAYPILIGNKGALADELFYSVLREITKTVAIICRKLDEVSQENFILLESVIAFAFNYISRHDATKDINASPSHGYSPTPRIEAAESLCHLYIRNKSPENYELLHRAINNSNSIIRFNAIRNIRDLFKPDYDTYLNLMISRFEKEEDSFVYAALLANLIFRKEKIQELSPGIVQLAYEKVNFFSRHNSFIENYTRLLLWLYNTYEVDAAWQILWNAYERPDLCHTVIFELFDAMHPSGAFDDDFYSKKTAVKRIEIIRHYVSVAGQIIITTDPEKWQKENTITQNALQVIDKIIQRIYFQLTPKRVGRSNEITLPVNDDNRRAFYLLIKPVFADIITLSGQVTARGLVTGHTTHYFIQSLNQVIQYDAKNILEQAATITRYSMQTGYTFDSSAIREIVILTERLLADHRSLLLEPDSFQHLIDLLDIYVQSGWTDALELLWKLDEVFK